MMLRKSSAFFKYLINYSPTQIQRQSAVWSIFDFNRAALKYKSGFLCSAGTSFCLVGELGRSYFPLIFIPQFFNMGEAELVPDQRQLIIHSTLYFYGEGASEMLSKQVAQDIADHWNEANGRVVIKGLQYLVRFNIEGIYAPFLTPVMLYENDHPRNNYFRIEPYAYGDISFVDAIGCNTGYFKLDNLLDHSTTAAHEYGHSLGLEHPLQLNIRGRGQPGIMYPRGSIVDAPYQWNPAAQLGEPGDTLNPFTRKVQQLDIETLRLHKLRFNAQGFAVVGEFSSVWHDPHIAGSPPV